MKTRTRYRFGVFSLDGHTYELQKSGIQVRIQSQPLRILLFLAERAGEIVTREELHREFWSPYSTVDLDRSLAAGIHKIRECLNDSVTSPRFIETIARSGYRFIAPITTVESEDISPAEDRPASTVLGKSHAKAAPPEQPTPSTSERAGTHPSLQTAAGADGTHPTRSGLAFSSSSIKLVGWVAVAMLLVAIAGAGAFALGRSVRIWSPIVKVLTQSGAVYYAATMSQGFPGAVSDGSRIYFPEVRGGRTRLVEVLLTGGDATALTLPDDLGAPFPDDVSPDGFQLLLRNHLSTAPEQALWIASTSGQSARQIPGVLAHDSTWMPDGQTILYANGNDLFTIQENGSGERKWASLPGRSFHMRWSPDGSRLRLTVLNERTLDTTLWEAGVDGSDPHPLLGKWNRAAQACCGGWSHDGRMYVFQTGEGEDATLWALREDGGFAGRREPFPLVLGPLSYLSPMTSRDGHRLFFTGVQGASELMQINLGKGSLTRAPDFLTDASRIDSTRDGRWVAWIRADDDSLWRSHADGSDRVRVLGAPFHVFRMRWSPDGASLAIMARRPGSPWKIYLHDSRSGHTEMLLNEEHNEADPDWTPDGENIVFGRPPQRIAEPSLPRELYIVNVRTRKVQPLPSYPGAFSPRLSPDGRRLVALSADQTSLLLMDTGSGAWSILAHIMSTLRSGRPPAPRSTFETSPPATSQSCKLR